MTPAMCCWFFCERVPSSKYVHFFRIKTLSKFMLSSVFQWTGGRRDALHCMPCMPVYIRRRCGFSRAHDPGSRSSATGGRLPDRAAVHLAVEPVSSTGKHVVGEGRDDDDDQRRQVCTAPLSAF